MSGCDVLVAQPLGDSISKKQLSTEFDRSGFVAKLDKNIYQVERLFVTVATFIMVFAVFCSIICDFFSTPKGKMFNLVELVMGESELVGAVASSITIVIWLIGCIFAVKTAKKDWTNEKAAKYGFLVGAAFLGFGKGLATFFPNGIGGAQRLSLCLMLWVVMLGSSMAAYTRRHIVLQAIRKLIPEHQQRVHAALGLVLASVFTLFLAWVGGEYAFMNLEQWLNADMKAGKFESVHIPYWTIAVAIPIGFGLTLARFCGHAIFIMKGIMEPVPTEEELKAARGEIGADADFDEFARLVEEEENEKNELESLAWKAATGIESKKSEN